jgi:hypothetical protein
MPAVIPAADRSHRVRNPEGFVDYSLPVRRLGRVIRDLIEAYPCLEYIGPDRRIEELARSFGLGPGDVVIMRAVAARRLVTVVGVLGTVWRSEAARRSLRDLREAARFTGTRLVVVPEHAATRTTRRRTARVIAEAAGIGITAEDRLAVMQHLIEEGDSTLHRCACVVSSAAPVSAVLAMASDGTVRIDLDHPLSPETRVELPSARKVS